MIVLDASALLALIKQEPGWDVVATAAVVEDATVSSVNYSETLQKAARLVVKSNAELLADDCFHAVFEAVKGLAHRIRDMSGIEADGAKLVDAAFGGEAPVIAFNALQTSTDVNEQRGLANIMKGLFSAVRYPQAHSPKLLWHLPENDALDLLGTLSMLHRRLDRAVVPGQMGSAS